MTDLTRALLSAAADLLAAHGFRRLRMSDVATRAGVSRQTVYNEFGNKERIVQAVAQYKTEEFLDGVRERLAGTPDRLGAVRAAVEFVFDMASRDPLTNSVLSGTHAEDMLPLVTTRGHPVLTAGTAVFLEHVRLHWPSLPAEQAELIAETVVRIIISHLLTPRHDGVHAVVTVTTALLT
ncbi:AcrR family transcriptional regulator [Saccharothrix tamanrassetensis]|uniref:AcrR family transcriptional regulator n=1 Tax=Saccharothrix tamanrassetensis TaxID=1051531 RepID=A0A841CHR5_9PSEU|nr:TetR family transcriptional regulator [Saccharothrix tamanrassetensis]MBB5956530.1 AcrR family transcriptional regulator [Saccharothrix tamanrassetensis]